MESAAILDIIYMRGLAAVDDIRQAKGLIVHIVQMLSRLDQRMGR